MPVIVLHVLIMYDVGTEALSLSTEGDRMDGGIKIVWPQSLALHTLPASPSSTRTRPVYPFKIIKTGASTAICIV